VGSRMASAGVAEPYGAPAHEDPGGLRERPIRRVEDDLGQVLGDLGDGGGGGRPGPVAELEEARTAALVAPDRRRAEHVVAEGVIVMPVGVDDDRDWIAGQLPEVVEDLAGLAVGEPRVDHQRLAIAADDADLLIEEAIAAAEDAISELDPGSGPI